MKEFRPTRIPGFYEFVKLTCPICGHSGGCMINEDGDRVACIRIESDRPFSKNSSLPSWLHFLKQKRKQQIVKENIEESGNDKLPDEELDRVYSYMIDIMELTDNHYNHLISPMRGLNDEQISVRGYISFPKAPWTLSNLIKKDLDISSFKGIPGFFEVNSKHGGKYWSLLGREGILIPYRNTRNQITGFQYRVDNPPPIAKIKEMSGIHGLSVSNANNLVTVYYDNIKIFEEKMELEEEKVLENRNGKILGFVTLKKGTRYYWLSSAKKTSGTGVAPSPVHISIPCSQLRNWRKGNVLKKKKIWLTEGALKGDISSDMIHKIFTSEQIKLYGDTFVAIPGVNSWYTVIPVLKEMGVEEINLAMDRDFVSNPYVMRALKAFMKKTKSLGYHVNLVSWAKKDGKGIDDLFINSKLPTVTPIF